MSTDDDEKCPLFIINLQTRTGLERRANTQAAGRRHRRQGERREGGGRLERWESLLRGGTEDIKKKID